MKNKLMLAICVCLLVLSGCVPRTGQRGDQMPPRHPRGASDAAEVARAEAAAKEAAEAKAAAEAKSEQENGAPEQGKPAQAEPEVAESTKGFDARLSQYDYPYEVEIFELDAQRQKLEMAYMDVAPEEGQANGHTVLLLHGKNFSGAYWKTTIEALVDRGYRVVVPDQIGFGKSSKPRNFQFTFHALSTYTNRLLEELGVDKVSVVGHSMGGMLATRFALMFPDTVQRLALVNPIGLEDWKRVVPYNTVEEWYEGQLEQTPEGVRAYMTESYFDGQWKQEYEPLVELQVGWIEGPDYERIAWNSALTYDMIFTQPVVYEFGQIEMPTLLIIGERDRTALGKGQVSPEVRKTLGQYAKLGKKTARAIPNSKLVAFEGIGHIPQYEAYDRYIKALTAFLPTAKAPAAEKKQ